MKKGSNDTKLGLIWCSLLIMFARHCVFGCSQMCWWGHADLSSLLWGLHGDALASGVTKTEIFFWGGAVTDSKYLFLSFPNNPNIFFFNVYSCEQSILFLSLLSERFVYQQRLNSCCICFSQRAASVISTRTHTHAEKLLLKQKYLLTSTKLIFYTRADGRSWDTIKVNSSSSCAVRVNSASFPSVLWASWRNGDENDPVTSLLLHPATLLELRQCWWVFDKFQQLFLSYFAFSSST